MHPKYKIVDSERVIQVDIGCPCVTLDRLQENMETQTSHNQRSKSAGGGGGEAVATKDTTRITLFSFLSSLKKKKKLSKLLVGQNTLLPKGCDIPARSVGLSSFV